MTSTAKLIRFDLIAAVDELGAIKAQISALKAREDELKEELIASGEAEAEGTLFRAAITQTSRTTTDWKAVSQKLEPSRQLITAHTTEVSAVVVRVSARQTS